MLGRIRRLNGSGDTIVEVMIVLAVLGLAISISYATANHSLLNARQAQENSIATEQLQTQVESLRTLSSLTATDPNYIFRSTDFCVVSGTVKSVVPASNCLVNGLYQVSIHYTPANGLSPQDGGTFVATASWLDVANEGQDTVTLSYRLYP